MRDPTKLRVVAVAEDVAVATYEATANFPRDERFGLTAQTRRAAVSIGSNIVEGCHRQGNRAFLPFLHHALGSAAELQFQIRLARRLRFGDTTELEALSTTLTEMKVMLSRLIVSLRRRGD
jgi:four helix bundle protein